MSYIPYRDNELVETMQACRNIGKTRQTLYNWAKDWGVFQVHPKHGKPKWRGRDINRMMGY